VYIVAGTNANALAADVAPVALTASSYVAPPTHCAADSVVRHILHSQLLAAKVSLQ
jgi:hypothetical protein